ncbi:MAG: hypothetical protein N3A54_05250 [Patescibacteria group bacterium]|nr:hypothetical protein [Patescibacteria group bacterium]
MIGLSLFFGLFVLFLINLSIIITSLIRIYGAQNIKISSSGIDDAALSEAVRILKSE